MAWFFLKLKMLSLKNVCVCVNDERIVKDVSIDVKENELHVLMGPNGSGKSTLIYGIMGHPLFKVEGKIELDGKSIVGLKPNEIVESGLTAIFQYTPDLEGVRLRNFLWNIAKNKVKDSAEFSKLLDEYLQLLKLDRGILNRDFSGFSGGEKKKLELLQVLLINPRYLLIDEIDSGVDVDNLKIIASVVSYLKKSRGIILVTHYTRILDYLDVDYVHVYKKGQIIKSGDFSLAKVIEEKGYDSV